MGFKRIYIPLGSQFKVVFLFVLAITVVETLNYFSERALLNYGLVPRETAGLIGVFTAPFLHGSFTHFLSNIIPFSIFAFLLLQHGTKRFWLITLFVILISGLLVWGVGRSALHVGASGLIYGYFAYLLVAGWYSRELKLLLISIFVGFVYGGMIWGIIPNMPFVSWEFHLFGFISGVILASKWGRVSA